VHCHGFSCSAEGFRISGNIGQPLYLAAGIKNNRIHPTVCLNQRSALFKRTQSSTPRVRNVEAKCFSLMCQSTTTTMIFEHFSARLVSAWRGLLSGVSEWSLDFWRELQRGFTA
jgi:hypothetical protein